VRTTLPDPFIITLHPPLFLFSQATNERYEVEAKLATMQERHQLLRIRTKALVEEYSEVQDVAETTRKHAEYLQAKISDLEQRSADTLEQLASVLDFLEARAETDPGANELLVALLESHGFRLSSRRGSKAPSRATSSPPSSLPRLTPGAAATAAMSAVAAVPGASKVSRRPEDGGASEQASARSAKARGIPKEATTITAGPPKSGKSRTRSRDYKGGRNQEAATSPNTHD
jgi:BMFP domain-containing protein YqiC